MTQRCFISIDIDDSKIQERLQNVQEQLQSYGQTSATRPSQFHVTLNFIGDVNDSEINVIEDRLSSIHRDAFQLTVKGIGTFPNDDYISVIWAGAEGRGLEELAGTVREQIPEEHVQDHDFHGHVTLVRVNNIGPDEKTSLQKEIAANNDTDFGTLTVDSFVLKKSKRTASGAEHKTIREFRLQ